MSTSGLPPARHVGREEMFNLSAAQPPPVHFPFSSSPGFISLPLKTTTATATVQAVHASVGQFKFKVDSPHISFPGDIGDDVQSNWILRIWMGDGWAWREKKDQWKSLAFCLCKCFSIFHYEMEAWWCVLEFSPLNGKMNASVDQWYMKTCICSHEAWGWLIPISLGNYGN